MRYPKSLELVASLLILLASNVAHAVSDTDVDIMIVFPEKLAPSHVVMVTDGELARGLLIPFAAIANNINLKKRSEELGAQLDQTLDGYDRYATIFKSLESRFKSRSAAFVPVELRVSSTPASEKAIPITAGKQGYDYVIVIEDKFSGLSMLNQLSTQTDDVAPMTTLAYRVYDTRKRERIAKGLVSSNGLQKRPYKEAIKDRELFVGAYERIANHMAEQLVGTLFREDKLHAMAASVGRGDEVPQVSAVMKRFEKRFDFTLKTAPDWKFTKMNSKYTNVLEPKNDLRFSLGLRFEVDLLIPEFGQDVSTVDEYVLAWKLRIVDQGIDASSFGEFADIDAPEGFRAYSLDLPGGGKQISLIKILNEDMLEMVSLVFSKDFATLYPQNRKKMESMIAAAKLEVR